MKINTLADLISLVESGGNSHAVRFEPDHKPAPHFIVSMMELAGCNYSTAAVLCAMSWGEFQIMGDELIGLGLTTSPFEYMDSPTAQTEKFNAYILADHLTIDLNDVLTNPAKRQLFARLYNGPGNVDAYAQRMEAVAKANGCVVL